MSRFVEERERGTYQMIWLGANLGYEGLTLEFLMGTKQIH